jgi:hypothetical protein
MSGIGKDATLRNKIPDKELRDFSYTKAMKKGGGKRMLKKNTVDCDYCKKICSYLNINGLKYSFREDTARAETMPCS